MLTLPVQPLATSSPAIAARHLGAIATRRIPLFKQRIQQQQTSNLATFAQQGPQPGSEAGNPSSAAGNMAGNRLGRETSPYLRQHAHNPVDWYPWGPEALEKAKKEDKIVFLSVGYATCHWCHVMERESFESEETAAIMNKHFVNIKVDREERPDVDRVYMSYVQATSGRGGWPMSVWLTPNLEPIYGGSYYPKKDMFQQGQLVMPGFETVLRRVASLWQSNREDLAARGADVMKRLSESLTESSQDAEGRTNIEGDLAEHALMTCRDQLAKRFDAKLGGFGGAPKFPRPSEIEALFHAYALLKSRGEEAQSAEVLHMATFSLEKMAAGGMFDHVGGGFHRYSVDEYWHVPHFEKMLYDQPPLACAYLDAFQITGSPEHARVARSVLDYLRRDMTLHAGAGAGVGARPASPSAPATPAPAGGARPGGGGSSGARTLGSVPGPPVSPVSSAAPSTAADPANSRPSSPGAPVAAALPSGGFFSAEDADSLDPADGAKKEGWFYVWTLEEVVSVLGPDRGRIFCSAYNVQKDGNCTLSAMSDPHHEFGGRNVPILLKPLPDVAAQLGMPEPQLQATLADCRARLHAARAARPRPSLDDKVVTAWNGMALSAFARASRLLAAEQPPCSPLFPIDGCSPGTYMEAALAAARFLRTYLYCETTHTLLRSYCKGPSPIPAFADDYANLVSGLLDLYECGGGVEWLLWAVQLQDTQDRLFWDAQGGGYFSTSGADPSIKIRLKDDYDGAEPAPSSVAAGNLLRLGGLLPQGRSEPGSHGHGQQEAVEYPGGVGAAAAALAAGSGLGANVTASRAGSAGSAAAGGHGGDSYYSERAGRTLAAFQQRLFEAPSATPKMCCASHLFLRSPLRQVVVAGQLSTPEGQALLDAVHASFAPDKVVIVIDEGDKTATDFFKRHNPQALAMAHAHFEAHPDAGPTVFVCQNFTCQAPTSDPRVVSELLKPAAPRKPKVSTETFFRT